MSSMTAFFLVIIVVLSLSACALSLPWPFEENVDKGQYSGTTSRKLHSESSEAKNFRDLANGVDRKTINGKTVPKRWCAWSQSTTSPTCCCQNSEYGKFLGRLSIGPLFMALLFLVLMVVFWGGRYCCFCCCNGTFGGRKPSKGICFTDPDEFEGYSSKTTLVVQILVIAACVIGIAFAITSFVGFARLLKAFENGTGDILNLGQVVLNNITAINATVSALPYVNTQSAQWQTGINSGYAQAQSLLKKARDYRNRGLQYKKKVEAYGFTVMSVTVATLIVAIILAALRIACPFYGIAILSMILGVLLWVLFAAVLVAGVVDADICNEFDVFQRTRFGGAGSTVRQGAIAEYAKCGSSETAFQQLQAGADSLIAQANDGLCQAYAELRANAGCACTDSCSPPDVDRNGIRQSTLLDGSNPTTILLCATSCQDANLKSLTSSMITGMAAMDTFDQIYADQVLPLRNCGYADALVNSLRPSVCVTFLSGCMVAFVGLMLFAGDMAFLWVATVLAIKRFNRKNSSDKR